MHDYNYDLTITAKDRSKLLILVANTEILGELRFFSRVALYLSECVAANLTDSDSLVVQAISKFESLVNQVQKNAQDIEHRLEIIEETNLFKTCPLNQLGELPRCKVQS